MNLGTINKELERLADDCMSIDLESNGFMFLYPPNPSDSLIMIEAEKFIELAEILKRYKKDLINN